MEEFLGIVWAVFHWRILLCVFAPLGIALGVSQLFGFPPNIGMLFNIFLLGIWLGVIWQSRSEDGMKLSDSFQATKVSKPIAFVAIALIGALLGAVESAIFESAIFGAISLFVVVILIGLWSLIVQGKKIPIGGLVFLTSSLLLGFASLMLLNSFVK